MLVTDDGISRLANELHLAKAWSPMLVTDDGIIRLANKQHPEKAPSPMLVTDDGTVTLISINVDTPQCSHESASTVTVPSGMLKCLSRNELHP